MPLKQLPSNTIIPIKRPQNFNEFIGHKNIKEILKTLLHASKIKKETIDHILFYGPPGTGKTSLAYILSKEINKNIHIIQGPQLIKPNELINSISLIQKNEILFIDEIHAISNPVQDLLLTIMEDFYVNILIGKDFNSRITKMKIPEFTLIGATTQLGKISKPLEERFGLSLHINFYTKKEILELLKTINEKSNIKLSDKELKIIALSSKGTPRLAIKIWKRIQDFKIINKDEKIEKILKKIGINENGLNNIDLDYLKILSMQQNPIGIKSISQLLQIDELTIVEKIEPFLLKSGYIVKTNKGRKLTNKTKIISYLNFN